MASFKNKLIGWLQTIDEGGQLGQLLLSVEIDEVADMPHDLNFTQAVKLAKIRYRRSGKVLIPNNEQLAEWL